MNSVIRGRLGEGFEFQHADGASYRSVHARADRSEVMSRVFQALTGLGFRESEARTLVDAVRESAGGRDGVEAVLKAALKEAAMPSCVREETPVYQRVA